MAKHRADSPWCWSLQRLKMKKYYLLNQWHYFKKPKLKKRWEDLAIRTKKSIRK